ncbi:MAG: S9 family peptidase [Thermoanaerobaculia bacterium]|nr:S9 family peptidase [Thermoanaerobaculia bacterium]
MTRPTLALALCLGFSPVVAPVVATAAEPTPIVTSDVLKLKTAAEIDVSADGRWAVYVVSSIAEKAPGSGTYRYDRHLWLAELAPGAPPPRQLTFGERSDGSPTFSPDGQRIAFVRADGENSQVWLLSLGGGEAQPVTATKRGADSPVWSPDGTRLLFRSDLPSWEIGAPLPWSSERPGRSHGDEPDWAALRDAGKTPASPAAPAEPTARPDGTLAEIRAWLAKNTADGDPRVYDRQDLQGEKDLVEAGFTFSHLFVQEARHGAAAVAITHGPADFFDGHWTPDGRQVVCVTTAYPIHPDRVTDSDLWIAPADGSGGRQLLDWPGFTVANVVISPDGGQVAFLAFYQAHQGYTEAQVAVLPITGGTPRLAAPAFDRDASDLSFSPDGQFLYFTAPDQGAFPLFRVPVTGGNADAVVGGPRGVNDYDFDGGALVAAVTSVESPWELQVSNGDGREIRRLTDLNDSWVSGKALSRPSVAWVQNDDGKRVQYWVMEPLGKKPGVKYPVVLAIHGGPSAMWGPGEFTMWHEFQLLASWGYGVVYANPRGSGGYGFDFRRANFQDWGPGPASDLLAALDKASRLPWVDTDQLVVTGGSYAGYMTAWLISQDHRFKAAVAQRGVYDLKFFFGEGNAWRLVPWHFGGYPWQREIAEILDRNSPITHVENIRTPLLIQHTDRDLRTGVNQSEALYKSLKVLGKPVEYVRYKEEGHELSRSGDPKRRMDRLNRIVEFFERFVKHPEPPPAGAGAPP